MGVTGAGAPEGALPFALRRLRWKQAHARHQWEARQLPPLGTQVGGYRLEALLGEGGQGTVYRARGPGGVCAVKLLPLRLAGPWAWRELEVLRRLRGPGIVALRGQGLWPREAPRFLFLVLEYVRGPTVSAWARKARPGARRVARLVLQLARVLEAVHRAGVVHRDVKGANVLVRAEDGAPVLVDFGVSTYAGALEPPGPLLPPGTPHLRSPEALRFLREHGPGERYVSTAREDLWALGVLLSWLLTGRWPFHAGEPDAVLSLEPVPPRVLNPRVPEALSAVCLRLLAKAPEARYPEAAAVARALEKALAGADSRWDVPLS